MPLWKRSLPSGEGVLWAKDGGPGPPLFAETLALAWGRFPLSTNACGLSLTFTRPVSALPLMQRQFNSA